MSTINAASQKNGKGKEFKLLKGQLYHLEQQYPTIFEADKTSLKTKTCSSLQDILSEKSDFLSKRAIVCDIKGFSAKVGGQDKDFVQFQCKQGLNMNIKNLNSFLDFCAIHGFIPMIDKILIEWEDISQVKEIYYLFEFALLNKDLLVANVLANEIEKNEKKSQPFVRQILTAIQQITAYTTSTYQEINWPKLQKLKNPWYLSENIFLEIALRIENEIRDKVKIESSYIKQASFQKDTQEKTDMHFVIRKNPQQRYNKIPTQFTISSNSWFEDKKDWVEKYLLKSLNKGFSLENNFIILAVNGNFKKSISDPQSEQKLNEEYTNWLNSPKEREKNISSKFPFFIDTIKPDVIKPAEVMYIALHLLYKKYDFRNSQKTSYLTACKKTGKIDKQNSEVINDIKLSEIMVDEAYIQAIKNSYPKGESPLKHEYLISYLGERMGKIVVYAI